MSESLKIAGPKIAVVLGSAASLGADLLAANALLGVTPRRIVAVNYAGVAYTSRIEHWVTLHPDRLPGWIAERQSVAADKVKFLWTAGGRDGWNNAHLVTDDIDTTGSSGLFAVRCMLKHCSGLDRVILCGMPMDDSPHFYDGNGKLSGPSFVPYRPEWTKAARAEFGGRVRSFSGWTRRLLGAPDAAWLNEVSPCT